MWVWSYVVLVCASDQGRTLYLGLGSCPRAACAVAAAALIRPHLAAACAVSLGWQQHRGSRAASVPMRGGSRRIIPHGRVLISKRFIKMGSGRSCLGLEGRSYVLIVDSEAVRQVVY